MSLYEIAREDPPVREPREPEVMRASGRRMMEMTEHRNLRKMRHGNRELTGKATAAIEQCRLGAPDELREFVKGRDVGADRQIGLLDAGDHQLRKLEVHEFRARLYRSEGTVYACVSTADHQPIARGRQRFRGADEYGLRSSDKCSPAMKQHCGTRAEVRRGIGAHRRAIVLECARSCQFRRGNSRSSLLSDMMRDA